jgi:drug/metabolite transporter (DMT)-like permease
MITALALAPVPTVATLSSLGAVAGVLIAPLFKQKVTGKDLAALPLAVVGGALVVSGSPPDIPIVVWPIMLAEIILLALSMHLFAAARVDRREAPAEVILAL